MTKYVRRMDDKPIGGCVGDLYEVRDGKYITMLPDDPNAYIHTGTAKSTFLILSEPYWHNNVGYVVDILHTEHNNGKYRTFWPCEDRAQCIVSAS